jgi:hypothetical protein
MMAGTFLSIAVCRIFFGSTPCGVITSFMSTSLGSGMYKVFFGAPEAVVGTYFIFRELFKNI